MNVNWFEKMGDYLSGNLSPQEQQAFETALANDAALSRAFTMYQDIEREMRNKETYREQEQALKETLQQLNEKYFNSDSGQTVSETNATSAPARPVVSLNSEAVTIQPPKQNKSWVKKVPVWLRYAIAACLIGITTIVILKFQGRTRPGAPLTTVTQKPNATRTNPPDTSGLQPAHTSVARTQEASDQKDTFKRNGPTRNTLFVKYFRPDAPPKEQEGPLEEAFAAYGKQDYAEAITAIDNADLGVATRGEEADQKQALFYGHYYKALSYLALGESSQAIPELISALAKSPGSFLSTKAQWYLALSYLKNGQIDKASGWLNKLIGTNTSPLYRAKAQALLRELSPRQ